MPWSHCSRWCGFFFFLSYVEGFSHGQKSSSKLGGVYNNDNINNCDNNNDNKSNAIYKNISNNKQYTITTQSRQNEPLPDEQVDNIDHHCTSRSQYTVDHPYCYHCYQQGGILSNQFPSYSKTREKFYGLSLSLSV